MPRGPCSRRLAGNAFRACASRSCCWRAACPYSGTRPVADCGAIGSIQDTLLNVNRRWSVKTAIFVSGFLALGAARPGKVEAQRMRARELGVKPGVFAPGALNAITDVAGVKVGQTTVIEGDSVRTGVTAILP